MTEGTTSISRTIETKGQAQIACLFLVIVIGIQVIPGLKMGNIIPNANWPISTFMIINFILSGILCWQSKRFFEIKENGAPKPSKMKNIINFGTKYYKENPWAFYTVIILGIIVNNAITTSQTESDPFMNNKKYSKKEYDDSSEFKNQYGKNLVSSILSRINNLFSSNFEIDFIVCKPRNSILYIINLLIIICIMYVPSEPFNKGNMS